MSLNINSAKFNITLNSPNAYKAGDTISGSLSLSSEQAGGQKLNVGSISITFSGRVTTSRNVRDIQGHRKSLQLFSYKRRLYDGPGQLYAPEGSAPGRSGPSFPFSFTFPSDCGVSQTENFEGAPLFNQDHNQPLPPSFIDEGPTDRGSVVYELSAELRAPGFEGYYMEGSFLQKQPLNVYTQRDVQEPTTEYIRHSKTFLRQSLEFFPPAQREVHKRPTTVSQMLGLTKPSSSHYPKATFNTTVLMPSIAVVGQALPLKLHIDHDTQRSTVATPPIIHLKRVQVWLRAETSICGLVHKALNCEGCEQTGWTSTSLLAQKNFDKAMPRVEHLDLRKVMNLNLDSTLVPTFKTFNVARKYSLRVAAVVACAGKEFHVHCFDHDRCTFLAKDFAAELADYTLPPPSVIEGDEFTDDPPPPYEQVGQTRIMVAAPREHSPLRRGRRGHGRHHIAGADWNSTAAATASDSAALATSSAVAASGGGSGAGGGM